eukprot:CAMPEP_0196719266 /NCGR_PEP_ID=MMETSP1091-20130531/2306_1 /TAXON_ID=302021 /ORGANISM="Rhodomonas sp., Strain CCMP768" /LENGTH=305 /DNA_ID=CAMNT_0042060187 /DNA_START=57 /DNA_END=974 /DNA_ORIENTATION=+
MATKLLSDIVTGGSATSIAAIFTNPFEVLKTRLQVQGELSKAGHAVRYNGLVDCAVKMAREEGILSLQKGLYPGMAYQFFMNGARLGCYPSLKRMFGDDGSHSALNVVRQVSAGAFSGALGAVVGSPLFMIKCRLQVASSSAASGAVGHQHQYKGLIDGLTQVFKSEGVSGLFRGVDGAVPRVMVGSASQLATYDTTKKALLRLSYFRDGLFTHFTASMVSGVVVTTIMNPFDVVSTRMYNQPQGAARVYANPLDCFAKTFRAEGVRGFYKGWLAHYARLGPHTVLTLVFWEQMRGLARRVGVGS